MVWEEAILGGKKRAPQILFAHIPETCDCWNTMCSSAEMCLAETAKQNKVNKWQRQEQGQTAPTGPDRNKIRSNVNRFWLPGPTYWLYYDSKCRARCLWLAVNLLKVFNVGEEQAKHITWRQTDYHTYLFSASLPSVCLQVWAWKTCQTCCQSISLHLTLQTWLETHTHTHTEKHTSVACVFKHARLFTCALRAPHKHILSLALLPMKESSHACTHRVRLRQNQAQIHTLALDANKNTCMNSRLSLASQACPIFKIWSTPTHILPCLDTPTAAHVRAARSRRTPCSVARQGELVRWSITTSDSFFVTVSL